MILNISIEISHPNHPEYKIPTEYMTAYQKGLLDFTEGFPQKEVFHSGTWSLPSFLEWGCCV